MLLGGAMLAEQGGCWRHTLDISGDGEANTGPRPHTVSMAQAPAGTVVNGLVIAGDDAAGDDRLANVRQLTTYFEGSVIRGPEAFVEVALGFADYADAMERKLLRELKVIAVSER